METTIPERYLTAEQAAEYLGFAIGTVRNMAAAGTIPSVKIGAARRFTREDLAAWVKAQNPAPEAAAV